MELGGQCLERHGLLEQDESRLVDRGEFRQRDKIGIPRELVNNGKDDGVALRLRESRYEVKGDVRPRSHGQRQRLKETLGALIAALGLSTDRAGQD